MQEVTTPTPIPSGQVARIELPVNYEEALRVCQLISTGKNVHEIEQDLTLPSLDTFFSWVVRDSQVRKAFLAAREMSSFVLDEKALWEAKRFHEHSKDKTPTQARALEIFLTHLRWTIESRNANAFGAKAKVSLTVPIQINTTLDLGSEGVGTKDHPHIYQIAPPPPPQPDIDEIVDGRHPSRIQRKVKPTPIDDPEILARRAATKAKRSAHMKAVNARHQAKREAKRLAKEQNPEEENVSRHPQHKFYTKPSAEELHREQSEG